MSYHRKTVSMWSIKKEYWYNDGNWRSVQFLQWVVVNILYALSHSFKSLHCWLSILSKWTIWRILIIPPESARYELQEATAKSIDCFLMHEYQCAVPPNVCLCCSDITHMLTSGPILPDDLPYKISGELSAKRIKTCHAHHTNNYVYITLVEILCVRV